MKPLVCLKLTASCAAVLAIHLAAGRLQGQSVAAPAGVEEGGARGFRLYSASIYGGYYSAGLSENQGIARFGNLQADGSIGGSVTLGWNKRGRKANLSFLYTPSYSGRIRYSEWNGDSHKLSFHTSVRLGQKWTAAFTASGAINTMESMMFGPTQFGQIISLPTSFDDLAGAVLRGQLTNPQLAALLTGGPVLNPAAQALFFGNRILSSSGQTSLTYAPTARTTITATAGLSRSQYLARKDDPLSPRQQYGYLNSTMANATAGLSYSYAFTPRTNVGVSVSESRVISTLQRGYTSTTSAFLGRQMGQHWFLQVHGGAGRTDMSRSVYAMDRKPNWIAGGSLGFKTYAHTFMGSYSRSVSDNYGLGASTSATVNGSWRWQRPGRNWSLDANFDQTRFENTVFANVDSWRASAGLGRMLGRHFAMRWEYAYMRYNAFSGMVPTMEQHAARFALVWTPGLAEHP